MKIDYGKDYRKILGICDGATESDIIGICTYILHSSDNLECIEAARVLINKDYRQKYDEERKRITIEENKIHEDIARCDEKLKKDYRKLLGISENDNQSQVASICSYVLQHPDDNCYVLQHPELKEQITTAADILINPESTKKYDNERKKIAIEKEALIRKLNEMADARLKEEKAKKKAERKIAAEFEKENKKIERKTVRKKADIEKKIDKEKKQKIEVVESCNSNSNELNRAKNTLKTTTLKVVILIIISGASFLALNNGKIIDKITTRIDKDDDNKDINYDEALNKVNAGLNEEVVVTNKTRVLEKEQYVKTFTNLSDDNQVETRANALNNYFKANNFDNYIEDDLINQIKYLNESYQASTDEAYDMQNAFLTLLNAFAVKISLNDTYISGVNEDGVEVGAGLDAYIADNSLNKEIVTEAFEKFKNLFIAKTAQEQVEAANELLALEHELMVGSKQNSNGEYISFENLNSNEGFLSGAMFYIANDKCCSILREDSQILYTNNNGEQILVNSKEIQDYYNIYRNDELNPDNPWVIFSIDLNNSAENIRKSYNEL